MSLEAVLERIAIANEKLVEVVLANAGTGVAAGRVAARPPAAAAAGASLPGAPTLPANPKPKPAAAQQPNNGGPTFEETRTALVNVKTTLGPERSRAIMQAVNAATATDIKPEDFTRVIQLCAEALDGV